MHIYTPQSNATPLLRCCFLCFRAALPVEEPKHDPIGDPAPTEHLHVVAVAQGFIRGKMGIKCSVDGVDPNNIMADVREQLPCEFEATINTLINEPTLFGQWAALAASGAGWAGTDRASQLFPRIWQASAGTISCD